VDIFEPRLFGITFLARNPFCHAHVEMNFYPGQPKAVLYGFADFGHGGRTA
jgi:hypothetical protein